VNYVEAVRAGLMDMQWEVKESVSLVNVGACIPFNLFLYVNVWLQEADIHDLGINIIYAGH